MRIIRAKKIIFQIGEKPIQNGAILTDGEIILALDSWNEIKKIAPSNIKIIDHDATVIPGVINAHTHLEFSHLRGKIKPGLGFENWAKSIFSSKNEKCTTKHLLYALNNLLETKTNLALNIMSTNSQELLQLCIPKNHQLNFEDKNCNLLEILPCQEFFGENYKIDQNLTFHAISGHSLYSTAPHLLQKIHHACAVTGKIFSIHLAESSEEYEFIKNGTGFFANQKFSAKYGNTKLSPVAYAHKLGILSPISLLVHCVHIDEKDAIIIANSGANICLCPCSNEFIGVGQTPWKLIKKYKIPFCIGTDSLASNQSLSVWEDFYHLKNQNIFSEEELLHSLITMPNNLLNRPAKLQIKSPLIYSINDNIE